MEVQKVNKIENLPVWDTSLELVVAFATSTCVSLKELVCAPKINTQKHSSISNEY